MIRLVATLMTAVVVVWIGSRVIEDYDTEIWQMQKTALRDRLAGAARSVVALAEGTQRDEADEPALEAAPIPPRKAFPPPGELGPPAQRASAEGPALTSPDEEIDAWRGTLDELDVELVRRRLDRVMTLAAGAGQ